MNSKTSGGLKVALACDWLVTVGGAEQVLKALHELYPSAPIYTSMYREKGINWFKDADIRTGILNRFPVKLRRVLGPLRQHYFSHLDLSDYDLVISVTGAEAKSVKTVNVKKGRKATHICYCHVPTQYYWGKYEEYLKNPGFGPLDPLARLALKMLVKPLRNADYKAAQKPDYYITISQYAAREIKKYYGREVKVINPPVNTNLFHQPVENSEMKKGKSQVKKTEQPLRLINFSRQVTWKRLDLIVKSCLQTNTHLTLIGDGPEHNNLVKLANGSNLIEFISTTPQSKLLSFLQRSDAFVFPSLEPFGIAPVEALAAGCPVIAYKAGGALDFIQPGKNGEFFSPQNVNSLSSVISTFDPTKYSKSKIANSADRFSTANFKKQIKEFISERF